MARRRYDARHEFDFSFSAFIRDSLSTRSATIIPIVMNDDAQGDPMDFKVNPEHSAWAEQAYPNCFPDSEIKNMRITFDIIVNKVTALETSVIKVQYALISSAFLEDSTAADEKSGETIKTILELQSEATDRQMYPLWSGIDMSNGSLQHALVPGLTSGQTLEGINWSEEIVTDQLRRGKVKELLRKFLPIGIRSLFVRGQTTAGYHKKITINFIPSSSKFINPYTFLGLMIRIPQTEQISGLSIEHDQPFNEVNSAIDGLFVIVAGHVTFNERNPDFHQGKV